MLANENNFLCHLLELIINSQRTCAKGYGTCPVHVAMFHIPLHFTSIKLVQ